MDSPATENAEKPLAVPRTAHKESAAAVWLDRAIIFWLVLFAVSAPHSIAATQICWASAMLFWAARLLFRPRPVWPRTPVDYALLCFVILTVISSLFSYDQAASLPRLRTVSLFTIAYVVAGNVRGSRIFRLLALILIASCMVNVFYTLGARVVGRGVRIEGVAPNSPLSAALFVKEDKTEDPTPILSGDTLLEVDGVRLSSPEQLAAALETSNAGDYALVKIYRVEWTPVLKVPRGLLLQGATPLERLGVQGWSRSREWRASGFYGHYTTYAEALQLIASLALGLLVALRSKRSLGGALLTVALLGMGGALVLTVTRASWLAFLLSAFVIVLAGTSRRTAFIVAACAIPLVLAGLLVLRQQRNVGFYDQKDQSITWRETVWREAFDLIRSKPRHLLVGVGMDSIKSHWREWGLFDGGRIPVGHMHSTPLQLALERGVPALLAWIVLLAVYAGLLVRALRRRKSLGWVERGILLGALGGLTGFVASGMVHYNFGDSEVVMIFYFIMGLSLAVERESREEKSKGEARPVAA